MDKKFPKKVYFTGIKGVGMTAAALCYQDSGSEVSGSDVAEEFVTDEILAERNIKVSSEFSASNIDEGTELLVYTGAHKGEENEEVTSAKERGIECISQAEAVGRLMEGKIGVSVGGVGGKTTTSSMIATILEVNEKFPSYLIGVGKIEGLGFPGKYDRGEHFVAEADEYVVSPGNDYTPKFMYQMPKIIVITNLAYDHPDVYESFKKTKKAFLEFFGKLPNDGVLIINGDDGELVKLALEVEKKMVKYGEGDENDYCLEKSTIVEGKQSVVFRQGGKKGEFSIETPGKYNAMNALAALVVGRELGMTDKQVGKGLSKFGGTKRRFEKIGEKNGILYFDDYAHHPSEIKAVLGAAKEWLSNSRIVAVFQPHTYSRTKALLDDFSNSFSSADKVIITDIFASARESKDESVTGKKLAEKIAKNHENAVYVSQDDLVKYLRKELKAGDAFFTLGAGNIYKLHNNLFVLGQAQI